MFEPPLSATARAVSQAVLGHDLGVNGYTTLDQAAALSATLGVESNATILEIGSANGWPGEYVARALSSMVVITDVPTSGLRRAGRPDPSVTGRWQIRACAADARHLPFPSERFDAVVHSDVLC